jgi:hypothetical protein
MNETSLYALAGGSGGVSYPATTLYSHAGQASGSVKRV